LPFEGAGGSETDGKRFQEESLKKMHSLYFPINWREAMVGVERALLLLKQKNIDKNTLSSKLCLMIDIFM
jgi:DNA-binding NtrC family response regulator